MKQSNSLQANHEELKQKFPARKKDLLTLCQKARDRDEFCEDLYFLEELNGPSSLVQNLGVNPKNGVAASEIKDRELQYGTNKAKKIPPKGIFELIWEALEDTILRILILAAIVSIVVNVATADAEERNIAWIDGVAILVAVFIAVSVTSIMNYKRDREFQRMNNMADEKKLFTVIRDGKPVDINQSKLVVGDVVKITEGMDIPVDGLIIEAHDITADHSSLTGETDPIKKGAFQLCLDARNKVVAAGLQEKTDKNKIPSPMLFAGTKVLTGDGYFVTLAVGENSSIGQIKALIMTETEATPLQQKLERIARDIGKFGLVSAILTLVVLLLRFLITMGINDTWSEGNQYKQLIDFFLICVAIIVVAIPEGLPVAVTLSLAFSVRKMMKDNNLVRRLEACETMGGANNICSDKTGTLTQNKMSLTKMWNDNMIDIDVHKKKDELNHYIKEEHQKNLLVQGIICNASATLDPPKGSKTDIALLEFMQKCGINFEEQRAKFLPEGFRKFPFSSARKRQSTILQNVEESKTLQRLHIKGASELILESATHFYSFESNQVIPLTAELRAKCDNTITEMASLALRTLCLAYKDIEPNDDLEASDANGIHEIEKNNLILFCIVGIKDVLRPNVKESVEKCRKAGIRVRMVTGDNKLTAAAIAKECGIIKADNPNSLVMEGKEFQARTGGVICKHCKVAECPCPRTEIEAKRMNKPVRVDIIQNIEEFKKIASQLDVLARSRPIDKYALVTGLKELGNVVAVTGDGTNDAPALKKANVGFAMGISGTEVAKEAAAIILMDDNFTSIVKAVMWGRNIYDCIKKFLQFQLTVNVVATICVFIGAAVLRQSVFNVVQLLWLNLIMDTLAALALATEPPTEELLNRKPHKKDEYIISRIMVKHILGQAVYQIAVIMVIVFSGDQWVPEYLTPSADLPADVIWSNPTSSGQHYVRSGRIYHLDGEDPDYIHLYDEYGPSRHFTFVFNTFVFMQIFNFFNCRKLRDEKNIFEGLGRSKTFIAIMLFIIGGQLIIGNLGGRAVGISLHYMDARQWLIAAAFGFGGWIVSLLLKILVPKRLFLKAGKAKADPVRSKSAILNLKRSNSQQSIQRKFSLQQQGTIGSKKPSIQSAVVPPPPHYPSAIELPRVASNFEIHYVK